MFTTRSILLEKDRWDSRYFYLIPTTPFPYSNDRVVDFRLFFREREIRKTLKNLWSGISNAYLTYLCQKSSWYSSYFRKEFIIIIFLKLSSKILFFLSPSFLWFISPPHYSPCFLSSRLSPMYPLLPIIPQVFSLLPIIPMYPLSPLFPMYTLSSPLFPMYPLSSSF